MVTMKPSRHNDKEITEHHHSPVAKAYLLPAAHQFCDHKHGSCKAGMHDGKRAHTHVGKGVTKHTNEFFEHFKED